MKTFAISLLKGVGVGLILQVPMIWWTPIFLQQVIPDFWLAVMTLLPVMLSGYVAARRTPRPILTGELAGLITMMFIIPVTGEWWVIPIMIVVGGAFAGLGAYIAVWAEHAAVRK